MSYGFIKVAAATPKIKIGDCGYNAQQICEKIEEVYAKKVQLVVFPELCITGYTCSDLFWQTTMLENARKQLQVIAEYCEGKEITVVVGLPMVYKNKLYNVGAVLYDGEVRGVVPKSYLPNYSEFYEQRHFVSGKDVDGEICVGVDEDGDEICCSFSPRTKFVFEKIPGMELALEICEDLWVPHPPSTEHALHGATVIANLSASDEVTGKDSYRKTLVSGQSARTVSAYIYADAGEGESTTDLVFAGHNIIAENGNILAEAERFQNETVIADIDLDRLVAERRRMTTFEVETEDEYVEEFIEMELLDGAVERFIDPAPFVPSNESERKKRCEEILNIQSYGLKKRLEHTNCKCAVVGISGGLDSTLALLVTVRAFDLLGLDRKGIVAVTMPGYGTTDRTYTNAVTLIDILGCTFQEVNISEATTLHLNQIGHDMEQKDVTYENAQARQRTYLLMDFANEYNGMVIGTGDLSELALGWATYNGDHMSMYGVNSGVPKTLVRHLVRYYADTCGEEKLEKILLDVLDTPVSPELLPPKDGVISQKTEDLVGPYELHDFFLYYVLRFGYAPKKILFLAKHAFENQYDEETILKWLQTFYRRFFAQQFKRSCLPDGPKVGSVAVSPRGDLRMPSDACVKEWLEELY
ncbi:MAG: NAD(+) synthase [Eubacterium sp.]|nr:NAD(+) synthase [Eubacterium sp.]